MRRGHPILIERRYWSELLALPADGALRDLLNEHAQEIGYIVVDNDSVLNDIDTPDEYEQERRKAGLS
jgi:molybdenum cofactor cytidylyltransferase